MATVLTPLLVEIVDELAAQAGGVHHPHRQWWWPDLQRLGREHLVLIVPHKTHGNNLVRVAWTDGGRAAVAKLNGDAS